MKYFSKFLILDGGFKRLRSDENLHIKYYKNVLVFLWTKTDNDYFMNKIFCKAKRLNIVFLTTGTARPTLCTEHSWCKSKKPEIERVY